MDNAEVSRVEYASEVQPSAELESARLAIENKLQVINKSRKKLDSTVAQLQRFRNLSQNRNQLLMAQQSYYNFLREKFFTERYPTRQADELVEDLDLLLQFYNFALMEAQQEKRVEQESHDVAVEVNAGIVIDVVPEVSSAVNAQIAQSGDHLLKGLGGVSTQVARNWDGRGKSAQKTDTAPSSTEFN